MKVGHGPQKLLAAMADTGGESKLYAEMKRLQTKLEFLDITESYVKDEMVSIAAAG